MLLSLSIKNFALIEKLNIDFSDNLSIITGETGAGKSILLGALGLVLGKRADLSSLKNKEDKCVIEAHFSVEKYNLVTFFETQELDYQDITIIRREILPSGKSRAFINDSPANLQQLQDLSDYLIDIHSQQQTHELSDEKFQFEIIDAIANNTKDVTQFQNILKEYRKSKNLLDQLQNEYAEVQKVKEYDSYQLQELLNAKLIDGDQERLEETYQALNNVELIKINLSKTIQLANVESIGTKDSLKEIRNAIQKIITYSEVYNQLHERINSVLIDFEDIIDIIEQKTELLINDPEQLELVNQKLQLIYNLQKKHQVNSIAELLIVQNQLDAKHLSIDELEKRIAKGSQILKQQEDNLNQLAQTISKKRGEAIPILIDKITIILVQLGMPNSRFKIDLIPKTIYNNTGKEDISLLFSANKGTDFGLLKKVASGGEMSRIMLAIKAILSEYSKLPTIIFDEIDTGVSGEISNKMAEIMKKMSQSMQVFAITHLPQIAAKGNQHYKVFKFTQGENTVSEIKLLNSEERILEIAEMLSGKNITDSALSHAKSLLS